MHRHLCKAEAIVCGQRSAVIGDERRRARAASDVLARGIYCKLSGGAARQNVATPMYVSTSLPHIPLGLPAKAVVSSSEIQLEWIRQPRCDTALEIHRGTTERAVDEYQSAGPWY